MIEKLDKFLIDRVFQPVVDLSQRKPRWWTLQTGILQTLLATIAGVLFGWVLPVFLMLIGWPLLTLIVCMSDETCSAYGSRFYTRGIVLFMFVTIGCCSLSLEVIIGSVNVERLMVFFATVLMLVFEYFAACRPPKPPVRRTSSKLSTSGAA